MQPVQIIGVAAVLIANLFSADRLTAETVDLNLVLAIDCSFSVSSVEYRQQMSGTAAAFLDETIIAAIQGGPTGKIGVSVVQWSNDDSQIVVVPWTLISTADDGARLARAIEYAPRVAEDGATSISQMIYYGLDVLAAAPFSAPRQTIDIAGDGENNIGPDVRTARDLAVSYGVTINGLAITNARENLHIYYRNNVIGGVAPFVEVADDFDAYGEAIKAKLLKEIRQPTS